MEKVLNDPSTGIRPGRFPKPGVTITRSYQCESPRIVADSTQTDSLLIDSTLNAPDGELPSAENTTGTGNSLPVKTSTEPNPKPSKKDQQK
jgi:penicillin-binding protein 1A